jgi:hypothetical protein
LELVLYKTKMPKVAAFIFTWPTEYAGKYSAPLSAGNNTALNFLCCSLYWRSWKPDNYICLLLSARLTTEEQADADAQALEL